MTESKDQVEVEKQIYQTLSKIDVSKYVKKKMGLDYLPWATAWGLAKSHYPDIEKKITEYPEYLPTNNGWVATGRTVDYRLTIAGCEVEASVIIEGQKYSSQLYVIDNYNRADMKPNYSQINKTQMRALVKALAFAGLGLNVYAGEDLPSSADKIPQCKEKPSQSELISAAKKRKVRYGGRIELVTDIVGLEMDYDRQASIFLDGWCAEDKRNQNIYEFIKKNGLATHGMKVGA